MRSSRARQCKRRPGLRLWPSSDPNSNEVFAASGGRTGPPGRGGVLPGPWRRQSLPILLSRVRARGESVAASPTARRPMALRKTTSDHSALSLLDHLYGRCQKSAYSPLHITAAALDSGVGVNSAAKWNRGLTPIFFAALLGFAQHGQTQACRVVDPELQGSYSGPCVDGLAEGEGSARGIAEYRGAFKAGRKHGRGVKTWPNGDRYEGEFAHDAKSGYGVYEWGRGPWQGERYEGDFVEDRRHGYGMYWWPYGDDVYAGPWENDRPTGPGTDMMRARAKFAAEARAAVAREGQKVCREMKVGIGGRDWVRGMVVAVEGEQVGVRIDDPGKYAHYTRNQIVWDVARAWTPCW